MYSKLTNKELVDFITSSVSHDKSVIITATRSVANDAAQLAVCNERLHAIINDKLIYIKIARSFVANVSRAELQQILNLQEVEHIYSNRKIEVRLPIDVELKSSHPHNK